jgi:hypothetical protein
MDGLRNRNGRVVDRVDCAIGEAPFSSDRTRSGEYDRALRCRQSYGVRANASAGADDEHCLALRWANSVDQIKGGAGCCWERGGAYSVRLPGGRTNARVLVDCHELGEGPGGADRLSEELAIDLLPGCNPAHGLTDGRYLASSVAADDHREHRGYELSEVTISESPVHGLVQAGGFHTNEDLARLRFWNRELGDPERLTVTVDNDGSHVAHLGLLCDRDGWNGGGASAR